MPARKFKDSALPPIVAFFVGTDRKKVLTFSADEAPNLIAWLDYRWIHLINLSTLAGRNCLLVPRENDDIFFIPDGLATKKHVLACWTAKQSFRWRSTGG
jgi:hypothetical protein